MVGIPGPEHVNVLWFLLALVPVADVGRRSRVTVQNLTDGYRKERRLRETGGTVRSRRTR